MHPRREGGGREKEGGREGGRGRERERDKKVGKGGGGQSFQMQKSVCV